MIEDFEDGVDELPDSDFYKAAVGVFDEMDNGKGGLLPSSKCFYSIETLGGRFIVRS